MKFWELVSVCREEPELMERLGARPEWAAYAELDAELLEDLCVYVLSESRAEFFHRRVTFDCVDPARLTAP